MTPGGDGALGENVRWVGEVFEYSENRASQVTGVGKLEDFATLYHRAFAEYGVIALWNLRELPDPTPQDAMTITRSLRIEGDLNAWRLAEQIERACRASV
jgi:hypothetical protein